MREPSISAIKVSQLGDPFPDAELAELLKRSEDEIHAWSRGRDRVTAPDGIGPATMAADAAERALSAAGRTASEVDFIIFATDSSDMTFPGSGCLLQAELVLPGVPCLDVRTQCTGFLTSLDLGRRLVMTGAYQCVLVATGDVPTHVNRYDGEAPELAMLTGDGATVALIEPERDACRILACATETDGRKFDDFWCELPASRHIEGPGIKRGIRISQALVDRGALYPVVDMESMRETALMSVPQIFSRVLDESGTTSVDATIFAHLLPEVEDELADRLKERTGRVLESSDVFSGGNTVAARLARAIEQGDVRTGERVALAAAGAGATWGAAVIEVSDLGGGR